MKIPGKHYRREKGDLASGKPVFHISSCRYDDLVFWLISDAQKKIVHLTFSKTGHEHAVTQLSSIYPDHEIAVDEQYGSPICQEFIEFVKGRSKYFRSATGYLFLDQGTEFQKRVWKCISRITYGRTKTYSELASELGDIRLARAVGQACGRNPLALIIPCHRVVGMNNLGGFAGGISIKKRLLAIEKG